MKYQRSPYIILLVSLNNALFGNKGTVLKSSLLTELYFVDDVVITASTRENITKACMEVKQVTTESGFDYQFS